jgi:hypothetical protein
MAQQEAAVLGGGTTRGGGGRCASQHDNQPNKGCATVQQEAAVPGRGATRGGGQPRRQSYGRNKKRRLDERWSKVEALGNAKRCKATRQPTKDKRRRRWLRGRGRQLGNMTSNQTRGAPRRNKWQQHRAPGGGTTRGGGRPGHRST